MMDAVAAERLVKQYINAVTTGKRIAGEYERRAVERHLNDLKQSKGMGWRFEPYSARIAFDFFSMLKHSKGEFAGHPFELSDWQAFIVWCLFGWKRTDGTRRFRYAYVEIGRKNGKTTFAAAVALYMLVLDQEQGAEVYMAATTRGQARICWTEAKNMVSKSTELREYVQAYQNTLVMDSTLSKMEPLSRDSDKLDGLNPHFAVIDEYHAHKTDDLFNVIKSAMGARMQPMMLTITTAGFEKTSPCYEARKVYTEVLKGIKQQDNTFIIIFTLDEGDDWKDRNVWIKSNPNMGISVKPEYLDEEYESAINRGGTEEVNFKTKNLNMWVDAPVVWIRDEKIVRCDHGITDEDLNGKLCYAGLDLASHVDINAFALYFPDINGVKVAKMYYFIPEGKLKEQEDRVDYRKWWHEGRIFVTEGDVIDIDYQIDKIYEIVKKHFVKSISFDPAKAYHGTIQGLQKKGFQYILDEFPQNIRNMSEPTKALQKFVEGNEIDLMDDPVLRWMFRNAVVISDSNDNVKLDKKRSQNKIDGLVALINAIGGGMSYRKAEPYTGEREIRSLNF